MSQLMEWAGAVLITWAAVVGVASVVVHSRVPWWTTELGRHLMIYMSVIAAVLAMSAIRFFVGDAPWFQVLRFIVFIGVPLAMTQRLWLQIKAQRLPRPVSADTHSGPDPA